MAKNPVRESEESYESAAEAGGGRHLDSELLEKFHQRTYNPIDEAERGTVSEKLNGDAGKMRYGNHPI